MTCKKVAVGKAIEISYEEFGESRHNPPVILISGAGLQMLGWPEGFCRMLAERGHRVIRFDNRDTGESTILDHLGSPSPFLFVLKHKLGIPVKPPYTLEDMALDLVGLMDKLGIAKAHLVGISLGGMIAQTAAIRHGERVASLTCIATQARNSRHAMPKFSTVMKIMKKPKPGKEGYVMWNLELVHVVGGPAAEASDDYLRDIAEKMYDRGIYEGGLNRQVCAVYASEDRRPALKNVKVPTLVIHGAQDPLISPEASREIAEAVPGALFHLIDGMGHGILQPVWEELARLINAHIRSAKGEI